MYSGSILCLYAAQIYICFNYGICVIAHNFEFIRFRSDVVPEVAYSAMMPFRFPLRSSLFGDAALVNETAEPDYI